MSHQPSGLTVQRPGFGEFPPGARMPSRVLEDCELVWMLQGRAVLDADPALHLPPGGLLFLPAGHPHGIAWDPDGPSRHGYVHFTPGAGSPTLPAEPVLVRMTPDDPLVGLCAYLGWLGTHEAPAGRAAAEQVVDFVLRLLVELPLPVDVPDAPTPAAFDSAVGHLRRAWATTPLGRIPVTELAAASAVSRAQLHRAFRAAVGVGPAAAMEWLRCARAEAMLLRTDLTLTAVARECGYADVAHFSHRFRAAHDVAPGEYRLRGGVSVLERPGARLLERLVWG